MLEVEGVTKKKRSSKPKKTTPSKEFRALRKTMKGKYWKNFEQSATEALASYTTTAILKDEDFQIEKIYSRSNKAVHFSAKEGEFGVKLKGGGYAILRNGVLYTETDYANALKGVDAAIGGGSAFEDIYYTLDTREKAKLKLKLRQIDWSKVWSEDYDPETGLFRSEDVVDQIARIIREIRPDFEY